jgi:hypothetical protein
VLFVGDAARTCDPITGEGIDQAMRSAHAAAVALRDAIRRRSRPSAIGAVIARSNLRLGQDSAMIARLGERLVSRRAAETPDAAEVQAQSLPLISAARGMLASEIVHPVLSRTPAGGAATQLGFGEFLDALDERLRDRLRNEFVMTSELIYREVCAGLGPLAAVALAAGLAASGARAEGRHLDAAVCVELLCAVPSLLGNVTQAADDRAKRHNALAVTTADFALAQASACAAGFGPRISAILAEAIEASSAAAALLAQDRHDVGRPAHRYIRWASLGRGGALSMAARMGACLADADELVLHAIGAAGESLGIAAQICEDVLALLRPDPVTGHEPYELVEQGDFRLPVLLAIETQPQITSLLAGPKDRSEWEGVVDVIGQSDAPARAGEMCRIHAQRANDLAGAFAGNGAPLAELCDLPPHCLSAHSELPRTYPAPHATQMELRSV